jgi:hypothetical protein
VAGGKGTFATSTLSVGTHVISVVYSGDTNFTGSTSGNLSQTVNQDGTSTTVVSSANPSGSGQNVTFTATVTASAPGSGTPTGTATFKDGATTLATVALSGGQAAFSTSTLSLGTHPITVSYSGDVNFTASTSGTLTQTVGMSSSTTTLASSANAAVFGQSVTFTATVTGSLGTPTGTITFKDAATTLGTSLLSGGKATFTSSSWTIGVHPITATYSGDSTYSGSTSSTLSQTINQDATTTTVVSSVDPSVFGQSVTFTATVTANAPGSGTPTGTVTFKDNLRVIGTGALNGSAQATFTTSALGTGSHSITATYSGDTNFTTSNFLGLNQTVNADATTTSLVSSVNPSVSGQAVTFTATVTANAPGSGVPTGTVTFRDDKTTLGVGTLNGSGVATFTTTSLAVGTHPITAVYAGSVNYLTSTSNLVSQTVTAALSPILVSSVPSAGGNRFTPPAGATRPEDAHRRDGWLAQLGNGAAAVWARLGSLLRTGGSTLEKQMDLTSVDRFFASPDTDEDAWMNHRHGGR